ncbi:pyridoxamine 5'-phosphate oxidase family protein [Spirosoma terrae]|uniref:Pyridoxamine 5'-phosphate oxidase family protein n=1 Tax=Spirosoma terrae TaxID=1968276 RepID=A0A6L9L0Q8_9BACT|nr:pyridoxamine 5'-phosphate oxidase family protein [Spirosoma terrae]NDU94084.1 hypothetical protein [Spirosoma terrae]
MLAYLSEEVIDHMLTNQWFGRLGCAAGHEVLVVPVTYFYDGQNIYGHTREGSKTRLMRQNPNVCLEIDEIVSPTFWRSVVVLGTFEELAGDERSGVLQRLGQRLPPLFVDEIAAIQSDQADNVATPTVVYRIRITQKTGRSLQRS